MNTYGSSLGSRGRWREYPAEEVKSHVREAAGNPDLSEPQQLAQEANRTFELAKAEIDSILLTEMEQAGDRFLEALREELGRLEAMSPREVAEHLAPKGSVMTRDTTAMSQRSQLPPHMTFVAEVKSIRHAIGICSAAAQIATKACLLYTSDAADE